MKYEIIQGYNAKEFRSITGVTPGTFSAMLEQVKTAYSKAHQCRGRYRKLSPEDMLLMTLEYYKEYRTLECTGASYGLKKTNVGKVIKWVEEVLIESGLFSLPGKKKLLLPVRHKEDIAKLSEEEKAIRKTKNKKISSVRMKIEHIIGRIKNFKIVAEKCRNKRKRLLMRFNLICGIVNFQNH